MLQIFYVTQRAAEVIFAVHQVNLFNHSDLKSIVNALCMEAMVLPYEWTIACVRMFIGHSLQKTLNCLKLSQTALDLFAHKAIFLILQ